MRFHLLLLIAYFALVLRAEMNQRPEIDAQGRVTFTVEAPSAAKVQIVGKGNGNGLGTTPITLSKSTGGTWSVTTDPVRPGFHYYDLLIDGVATTDPANRMYFGWGR